MAHGSISMGREQKGRRVTDIRAGYDVIIVGGGHNGLVAASYLGRAGLSVLVLEKNATLGGAVASAEPFPGVAARLSRYSYLVSLLPDRIVQDLGLDLQIRSRRTASYTPIDRGGEPTGLLVEHDEGPATAESFRRITGSDTEYEAWRSFYARTRAVAEVIAPTVLDPLPSRETVREAIIDRAGTQIWTDLFERPIGEAIERRFADDTVRGVVLTDAIIGTHTHAHDASMIQNRVFLYHVVGNGTGEWRVPVGGMGAVAAAMERAARSAGSQLVTRAEVTSVDAGSGGVAWRDDDGNERAATARFVLANVAPSTLQRLRDQPAERVEGSQLKINMVLHRLPHLRSGADPQVAFAGTFHIDEGYDQLEAGFRAADAGALPDPLPSEIYCHTLTDPSILAPDLVAAGWHTLTMFGLHAPARLFATDHDRQRDEAVRRALAGLDRYLAEPIADCLAIDADGDPCIEARTPVELEHELGLPGGNIFHGELQWPWADVPDDRWGVATDEPRLLICGSGARRGGAVSGIAGHNAAQAVLDRLR
jgi:phytoene dehydrogenase-like protein